MGDNDSLPNEHRHGNERRGGMRIISADCEAPRMILTEAHRIEVQRVRWLWDQRLAIGSFALLGGREGIGKSLFAFTLAADITRGRLPGAFAGDPGDVIIAAATEDSWAKNITPRFMAAGADMTRIHRLQVEADVLELPRDLTNLKAAIEKVDAKLVIFDPLLPRLNAKLDTHKDADVRRALEGLVTLAEETDATVLGLIHVNKGQSRDALTMLMGSRAFVAVARAVLFVHTDPDDESIRLLGQVKNNLGRGDLPTLTFTISEAAVETREGPVPIAKLEWQADSPRSIREALEVDAPVHKTVKAAAKLWLIEFLTAHGGTVDCSVANEAGAAAGYSKATLDRARRDLGVVAEPIPGTKHKTTWSLPVASSPPGVMQLR